MSMDEQDKTAQLVLSRWKEGDKVLLEDRRNYWLNYAFYAGHQWVTWDPNRSVVQNFAPALGTDTMRVRLTINKIQERAGQLMGRLLQRNLAFESMPTAADDATLEGARLAEAVIEAERMDGDWESIREEALFGAFMGGTSAVALEWDGSAGKQLWKDAQTNKIVGTGSIKLTPLSIAEFSLEAGSRREADARYWTGCTAVPPKQVKAHYNLSWTPDADASQQYSPLQREILGARGSASGGELTAVYVMYERPNSECEAGRRVVVVNNRVVAQDKWPFPFKDRLNIRVFRQIRVPQRWTGLTVFSAARAPQIAYNQIRSAIVEHAKLAGNARLMVPKGSFDDDTVLTDEPGEIIEYWADQGQQPQYLSPPQLPRWLTSEADRLEAELDGILMSHAVSRGMAPGDRNSGLALSILAEKNDTPLGPMSRDQANGWGEIGSLALEILQAKATESRTAIITTDGGVPRKLQWNGAKLRGQTQVSVPLDATLPQSRMATQAMLTNLAGSFPQFAEQLSTGTLARVLDMPGSKLIAEVVDDDAARAIRENDLLSVGEVTMPERWHDHARHISEHNRFRNSNAFEGSPEEVKELFAAHIEAHQRLIEEEAVSQAELNQIQPGFGALPQANNPVGSAVPPDWQTQQTPAGVPPQ